MKTDWTPESLASFERDIADTFNKGLIRAPVHLSGGNEGQLIEIFQQINPDDWVCCTWRSHFHCLLKGVPPDVVKRAIINGRSIALCFPEYKIISSALVGGIAPIALGLACSRAHEQKVWCFLGDMAMRSGIVTECYEYATGHDLPLNFVVEDNGKSVSTDTDKVWGMQEGKGEILSYDYKLTWPHVGTGQWVHMQ